jgi:hypothetical protein
MSMCSTTERDASSCRLRRITKQQMVEAVITSTGAKKRGRSFSRLCVADKLAFGRALDASNRLRHDSGLVIFPNPDRDLGPGELRPIHR